MTFLSAPNEAENLRAPHCAAPKPGEAKAKAYICEISLVQNLRHRLLNVFQGAEAFM